MVAPAAGAVVLVRFPCPGKLFTASSHLIAEDVGVLTPEAFRGVLDAVTNLLRGAATAPPETA